MVIETSPSSFVLALAALLGSASFLGLMWRRRREPTARPLFALAAVLFTSVAVHLLHVHFTPTHALIARTFSEEAAAQFWVLFVFVCHLAVLGLWVVFVFEYTGRGQRVTRLVTGIVGGLFVTLLSTLVLWGRISRITTAFLEVILVISLLLVFVLAAVGIFLVIDESTRLGPLLWRETLVLSGAAGTLLCGAWLLFSLDASTQMFTSTALLSSLLFVFAIRHYAMFETLPVASVLGRDRVIEEMTEAVLVVGQNGEIQDANPAALSLFENHQDAVLGAAWTDLLPTPLSCGDVAQTDQPVRIRLAETVLAVTASEVRDERERLLGYLVVCQDVTDRREREQRLALLNRFLVSTVGDRMDHVAERADSLASEQITEPEKQERLGTDIWATTSDLITLLTYIREIERGLATEDDQRSDVGTITREVAESVTTDESQPTVTVEESPVSAAIEPPLLESTLELLLAEAIEVPPEMADIAVRTDDERVQLCVTWGVADVGNGDPVDRTGLDTLSAQLVELTVESAGGTVSIDSTGNSGSVEGDDTHEQVTDDDDPYAQITITLPGPDDTGVPATGCERHANGPMREGQSDTKSGAKTGGGQS